MHQGRFEGSKAYVQCAGGGGGGNYNKLCVLPNCKNRCPCCVEEWDPQQHELVEAAGALLGPGFRSDKNIVEYKYLNFDKFTSPHILALYL